MQGGSVMLSERLLKLPGFLYQIGSNYYYLGKWICKKCTHNDMNMILESLSEKETTGLLEQIAHLEEDVTKY